LGNLGQNSVSAMIWRPKGILATNLVYVVYVELLYVLQGFSAGFLFPGSQLWFIVAFCVLLFYVDYSL
jgi:hypothetical protein